VVAVRCGVEVIVVAAAAGERERLTEPGAVVKVPALQLFAAVAHSHLQVTLLWALATSHPRYTRASNACHTNNSIRVQAILHRFNSVSSAHLLIHSFILQLFVYLAQCALSLKRLSAGPAFNPETRQNKLSPDYWRSC